MEVFVQKTQLQQSTYYINQCSLKVSELITTASSTTICLRDRRSPINRTRLGIHRHYTGVWLLPVHVWYPMLSFCLRPLIHSVLVSSARGYLYFVAAHLDYSVRDGYDSGLKG
jgi:hypothetical protein